MTDNEVPTTSTAMFKDGAQEEKLHTQGDRPTQSTQDTVVQQPLNSQNGSIALSIEQLEKTEATEGAKVVEPQLSTSSEASFCSAQRMRIAKLKQELLAEEKRVLAVAEGLNNSMREQVSSALVDDTNSKNRPPGKLDSIQQLSHSILDEESYHRLKLAKPLPSQPESATSPNSISVDMTPLTEDLLMNSRVDQGLSDGAQTISDGLFPNDENELRSPDNDDDGIIFMPLSDDDFVRAFATPPRVVRNLDKKVHKPTPRREKIQLQSEGKVIGITELGSYDDSSSFSISDKGAFKGTVKPLKRHAWTDSETENSLSRSLVRKQIENLKNIAGPLSANTERDYTSCSRPIELEDKKPSIVSANLSPHEGKYRPATAPSSERFLKFDIPPSSRVDPTQQAIDQRPSDSSVNSNDYPNLRNSFVSLQNNIKSDITALRQAIVEKQECTEKLRAEFFEFKDAYYKTLPKAAPQEKELQDAHIQTTQTVSADNKENTVPAPSANTTMQNKNATLSECDSETDRQLATLRALQRSLRKQSNKRYLQSMQDKIEAGASESGAPQQQEGIRSLQTGKVASPGNSFKLLPQNGSTDSPKQVVPPSATGVTPISQQHHSDESSLDSNEQATREMFMEILRKKADIKEKEQIDKLEEIASIKKNRTSVRVLPTSTPRPGTSAGKSRFTPSVVSEDSTLTDETFLAEDDLAALNVLWNQFTKFVVQSKALKPRKSRGGSKQAFCFQVDVSKLKKLEETLSKENQETSGKCLENKEISCRQRDDRIVRRAPETFDVSIEELKEPRDKEQSLLSHDSRQERIDRLIEEIESERRKRSKRRVRMKEGKSNTQKEKEEELIPVELDSYPVKDHKETSARPPIPPARQRVKSPVAFEISLDGDSVTSEEPERAPGYPNMVFKTGKLQNAFHLHNQRFIRKSRKRALCIQLCKEARQKYATSTPPERPRPTIDTKLFSAFNIPPPRYRSRVISHRDMTAHSRKLYERLEEVQNKKKQSKVARERETYRLRAKLFSKQVQGSVLNKKFINTAYFPA